MEASTIEVNCSPKTFTRVQSDPEYQAVIINKVQEEHHTAFDEVIFSENPTAAEHDTFDDHAQSNSEAESDANKNWLDALTKLLISWAKELRPLVGKTPKLKNKRKMWIAISEKLCEKGYMYRAQQVESKFYSLERRYKKVKLHNSLTGRNKETCPYQSELDDLFEGKKSINPEYVLDEESSSITDIDAEETDISFTSTADVLTDTTKIKKRPLQAELLQQIKKIAEDTKMFKTRTLQFLESKEQRDKRREERAEREEDRKKRKMELLEKLVEQINK